MNLKPLYVSLVALGLVSGSALAATTNSGAIKAQEVVDQNSAVNPLCTVNWADRIFVGGLFNFDGLYGSHSPIYSFTRNDHGTDLQVSNATMYLDAKVNNWVNAHFNLTYYGKRHEVYNPTDFITPEEPTLLSQRVSTSLEEPGHQYGGKLVMDEAYVTIANFCKSPLYLRAGEQYVAFGDYERYPMVYSLTQVMEQTRAAALAAGFVTDSGLYMNLFAFNGPTVKPNTYDIHGELDEVPNIRTWGGKLGYFGRLPALGMADTNFNIDVSYIDNLYDTDFINRGLRLAGTASGFDESSAVYEEVQDAIFGHGVPKVPGLAGHLDISHGPIDFIANYVMATRDMVNNEWFDAWNASVPAFFQVSHYNHGSKLAAGELTGAYSFLTMGHDSKLGISYQWTREGEFTAYTVAQGNSWTVDPQFVSLPKNRWMADYMVNILKNTDLGFAFVHDQSYDYANPISHDNESRESNTGIVRLSVQF